MKTIIILSGISGAALLAAGCVEKRVVYVPAPQAQPAYTGPATPPPSTETAPVQGNAPDQTVSSPPPQPPPPSGPAAEAPMTPPAPMVETAPVAPGPAYTWTPGYWSWNGFTWVWVRGAWVVRPRVGAVWVHPHWVRRGHGYIWVGGYWR